MDRLIDRLPANVRPLVAAKAQAGNLSLGESIGSLIDEVLAEGWTYDKANDWLVKEGDRILVKNVWRALVEERG
jgi:hypothetical protein